MNKPAMPLIAEWLKRTPPAWMRRITTYKVLLWIDHRLPVCWTQLVLWKQFGATESWWPRRSCFYDPKWGDQGCYCEKFQANQEDDVVGPDQYITFRE